MTITEAKSKITSEFITKYNEWFADLKSLSDAEYGRKYGWQKSGKTLNGNQETYLYFHKYIFCGYDEFTKWVYEYGRDIILGLLDEKFLSREKQKWRTYCFISQSTVKQIYKGRRNQS